MACSNGSLSTVPTPSSLSYRKLTSPAIYFDALFSLRRTFHPEKNVPRGTEKLLLVAHGRGFHDYFPKLPVTCSRSGPAPEVLGPLQIFPAHRFLQLVANDIFGPLPLTKQGEQLIFLLKDRFTEPTRFKAL